jgi:hypothetical protein
MLLRCCALRPAPAPSKHSHKAQYNLMHTSRVHPLSVCRPCAQAGQTKHPAHLHNICDKGANLPRTCACNTTHRHGHDYELLLLLLLHSALLAACVERKLAHCHLRCARAPKVSRPFCITSSRQHQLTTADMLPSDKCLTKLQAESAALAHPALKPCLCCHLTSMHKVLCSKLRRPVCRCAAFCCTHGVCA